MPGRTQWILSNLIWIGILIYLIHDQYSPINDLLDSGIYTLEELLNEDELIQEVKAKNDRLIEL